MKKVFTIFVLGAVYSFSTPSFASLNSADVIGKWAVCSGSGGWDDACQTRIFNVDGSAIWQAQNQTCRGTFKFDAQTGLLTMHSPGCNQDTEINFAEVYDTVANKTGGLNLVSVNYDQLSVSLFERAVRPGLGAIVKVTYHSLKPLRRSTLSQNLEFYRLEGRQI
jgi:hypothetical protein